MRILFISSTRVGDAILSTGLLDRLIGENPGASITIACGPAAAPLFEAVPGLERIIVLDKMVLSLHWLMLWALCGRHVWDILVDLRNSAMFFLLPARKRHKLTRSRQPEHRVTQLARTLGLADNPPPPRLWLADKHVDEARRLVPDGPPVLAVGPWSMKGSASMAVKAATVTGKCIGRQPAMTALTANFSAVMARSRTGSTPTRWSGGSIAHSRQAATASAVGGTMGRPSVQPLL